MQQVANDYAAMGLAVDAQRVRDEIAEGELATEFDPPSRIKSNPSRHDR